jgi:hypothetical protein
MTELNDDYMPRIKVRKYAIMKSPNTSYGAAFDTAEQARAAAQDACKREGISFAVVLVDSICISRNGFDWDLGNV